MLAGTYRIRLHPPIYVFFLNLETLLATLENTMVIFSFSWNDCKSQEKLKTMVMQNFGVDKKVIMVFSKVANRNNFTLGI